MIDSHAIAYRASDRLAKLHLLEEMPELSPLAAEILVGRNLTRIDEVRSFISQEPEFISDPLLLRDMGEALERLRYAAKHKQRVLVHGDYDCDGICATALLLEGLALLGIEVDYHVPCRFEEGYGLSLKAVERCKREGFQVLLTADCGSSCHAEIEAAKEAGLVVIVTDHHQLPSLPPTPHALINPQHPEDHYPFKGLCGTAVAFKLLQGLLGDRDDVLLQMLDLVALATIADVVPLLAENRLLVKKGLVVLSASRRPGFKALFQVAGLGQGEPVDALKVAFFVAPRLNAAGRLQHASLGVKLLRATSEQEALEYVALLDDLNSQRKEYEQKVYQEIEERLKGLSSMAIGGAIVEWSDSWHEGVIGITAGRLSEKYGVPALVIAVDEDGNAKGSGRSRENVDLYQALCLCSDLFSQFGGHARAGGFSLAKEQLPELRERFCQAAKSLSTGPAPVWIDASLGLGQISFEMVESLAKLEPFGEANPRPVFLLEGVSLQGMRAVGKQQEHLQLELLQGGLRQRAIAFRQAGEIEALAAGGTRYDLVCEVGVEQFRGMPQLSIQVVGVVRPTLATFSRGDLVVDLRNSVTRRLELEGWLQDHEFYVAICRDVAQAERLCPGWLGRFSTYQGVDGPWDGFILLTPPPSLAELTRVLEVGQPKQLVILFGRQELDELDRAVMSRHWNRATAEAVWKMMRQPSARSLPLGELTARIAARLSLTPCAVDMVFEALVETGVVVCNSSPAGWSLARSNGLKLEQTQAFIRARDRRLSHVELLTLFSGPSLTKALQARFPKLGEVVLT